MAIAGGACQSIELRLGEDGKIVRGAMMMRQGSICIDDPALALMELRRGERVYLRLRGDELTRLMRLMEKGLIDE